MTIRKTTSIKTKNAHASAALANISIPTANAIANAGAASPGMRLHRLHHGHYAHHNVVIMASPSRRTSLLQRQVARALDCIDMDESVGENANENADGPTGSSTVATAYASPSTLPLKKTPPPSSSLAALSAPTFQISPNAVKRKRSHSMASTASSSSSGSAVATAGVASTASSTSSLVTDLRVDIEATNARVVAKRVIKGGVTPSKRCNGKDKKKKQKVDVIERALKRFRSELRDASDDANATNGPATTFEFTSLCPKDEADSARVATPRHHAHSSQVVAQAQRVRVQIGVAAAQGARAYMEDRFQVTAKLFEHHEQSAEVQSHASLLAVYDGHNGALAAEYAASRFRELLSDNEFLLDLCKRPACEALGDDEIDRVENILKDAFEVVDEEIVELTISEGKRDGSTVLLGLLISGKLFVANLGDTRGVLGTSGANSNNDGDDDVVRVSVDHKPDLKEETARVEEAGGKVIFSGCWRVAHDEIPLRLAVSRSLGDHPLKANLPLSCSAPLVSVVPDIQVLDVSGSSDDVLVFATDGLWDRLSDDDAIRIARTKIAEYKASGESHAQAKNAMQSAAIALVETALVKRSMDNITAMVVSFSTEETPRLDDVETLGGEMEEVDEDEMDPDL